MNRPISTRARLLRVLVVEDHEDTADSLATLLHLYGHDAQVARDGLAAIEAAQHDWPDVVLLDIGLPGLSGYQVARYLREQKQFKTPLLVAVTGYGGESDRQQSADAGIDLHMVKPVQPTRLEKLLDQLISSPITTPEDRSNVHTHSLYPVPG